jgi:hypothetical protein
MTKAITSLPPFKVGNMLRDTQETIAYRDAERGSVDYKKYIKFYAESAKSIATEDDFYKKYLLNGGGFNVFSEADSQNNTLGALKNTNNFMRKTWNTYNTDEYINRVAVAKEAIDSGFSWQQAVNYGRDITLDFQMGGTNHINNVAYATIPFYRASMNGAYKMVREIERKGKTGKAYIEAVVNLSMKGGAFLSMIGLMGYVSMLVGGDEDERKENMRIHNALTPDEKARFIHYYYGGEVMFRIPIPHAIGFIYAKVPEHITDAMVADVPIETTQEALKFALMTQILPSIPLLTEKGVLQPAYDLLVNKDFTGREIEPSFMKNTDKSPQDRYTDYTRQGYVQFARSDIGKAFMGRANPLTGPTPITMQYLFKAKFGYYEKLVGEPLDFLMRDEKAMGNAEKDKSDIASDFFLHNLFFNTDDNARSSWGVAFVKRTQKYKEVLGSLTFRENEIEKTRDAKYFTELENSKEGKLAEEVGGILASVKDEVNSYRISRGIALAKPLPVSSEWKKKEKRKYNRMIEEAYRKGYKDLLKIEKRTN